MITNINYIFTCRKTFVDYFNFQLFCSDNTFNFTLWGRLDFFSYFIDFTVVVFYKKIPPFFYNHLGLWSAFLSPSLPHFHLQPSFYLFGTQRSIISVIPSVISGHWLLTRRERPVKQVWLNALCPSISLTWRQWWWSRMSGSFISPGDTLAYCGSFVALRWLSYGTDRSLSLLQRLCISVQAFSQHSEGRIQTTDPFATTVT